MKKGGLSVEFIVTGLVIIALSVAFIPSCAKRVKQAKEDTVSKNLAAMRSAIALHCIANEGNYPQGNIANVLIDGAYITHIPKTYSGGHHKSSDKIVLFSNVQSNDTGEWVYKADDTNDESGRFQGEVWLNCTHKNYKGEVLNEL